MSSKKYVFGEYFLRVCGFFIFLKVSFEEQKFMMCDLSIFYSSCFLCPLQERCVHPKVMSNFGSVFFQKFYRLSSSA